MELHCYKPFAPRRAKQLGCNSGDDVWYLLKIINGILKDNIEQGFSITNRRLFYELVSRLIIPNEPEAYKRLCTLMLDAKDGGIIPWDWIVDESRWTRIIATWNNPKELISTCIDSYRINPWEQINLWPEVWVEKDAVVGIVQGVCNEICVPIFSTRGQAGQSALYEASKRFTNCYKRNIKPIVFYLGDHDPSGIKIGRSIQDTLQKFLQNDSFQVNRIALTINQARVLHLPPNTAKEDDPNYEAYCEEFQTQECWELDALPPVTMVEIIRGQLDSLMCGDTLEAIREKEDSDRNILFGIHANYDWIAKELTQ